MKAMLHEDLQKNGGEIPAPRRWPYTLRDVFRIPGFAEAQQAEIRTQKFQLFKTLSVNRKAYFADKQDLAQDGHICALINTMQLQL